MKRKIVVIAAILCFLVVIQFATADTIVLGSGVNITDGTIIKLTGKNCNITVEHTHIVDKLEIYSNYTTMNASLTAPTFILNFSYDYTPSTKIINITGREDLALNLTVNISTFADGIKIYNVSPYDASLSEAYLTSVLWEWTSQNLTLIVNASSGTNSTTQVYWPYSFALRNISCNGCSAYNSTWNATSNITTLTANHSSLATWYLYGKNASNASLTISPSSPINSGTQSTVICTEDNPEAVGGLYRNGTDVTATENDTTVTLSAGTWEYICNVSETENYTYASNSTTYIVNPVSNGNGGAPGGGGGVAGGAGVSAFYIEADNMISDAGEVYTTTFTIINNNEFVLYDIDVILTGIPTAWYYTLNNTHIESIDRLGGNETIELMIEIPGDARVDYTINISAAGQTSGGVPKSTEKIMSLDINPVSEVVEEEIVEEVIEEEVPEEIPIELDYVTIGFVVIVTGSIIGGLYFTRTGRKGFKTRKKPKKEIKVKKRSEEKILKEIDKLEGELEKGVSKKREKEIEKKIIKLEKELEQ